MLCKLFSILIFQKDVLLLNFSFWKIFNSFHDRDGINLIVKRIFTLSHLTFVLFFVEQKLTDPFHLAPMRLLDPLVHNIVEHSVVGG
jgi:hypothetical protein